MNETQKGHLLNALEADYRYDGRKKDEFRPITIEYGVTDSAEGSAKVKIGDTEVIAGVKMSIDTPYPDTPTKGNLMVNAELLPLSSPDFEPGPPTIESIELARVVDRGIRESEAIDTKKLCIKEGEQVWTVIIDICSINDDGNLLDASGIAALAAIKDAKFPEVKDGVVDYSKKTKNSLPLLRDPIPVTVYKVGDHFIVDPIADEMKAAEARLTVATIKDGTIVALQKGEQAPLSIDEIDKMVKLAQDKAKELRSKL